MKVTVENAEENQGLKFPCLMWMDNRKHVILSNGKSKNGFDGAIVMSHRSDNLGMYDKDWCLPPFETFKGKITLQND